MKAPESAIKRVGGKPTDMLTFPLTITSAAGPIQMDVVTDKERHVLAWRVPVQKYAGVREGFQELAK
jgi:hypothetical protein